MEQMTVPDSVMRMEAVQAAVATTPELGETMPEFMARVQTIYCFLAKASQEATRDLGAYVQ